MGLRQEVRRLRRRSSSPRSSGAELGIDPARHRDRGHAQPRLAGLHRRLGLRAGLVHEPGRRDDQRRSARRSAPMAPAVLEFGEAEARALQPRAPRHLPLAPRSSRSAGCAPTCPARRQEPAQARRAAEGDRHHRRLRRPPHHQGDQRRRRPPGLAGRVRAAVEDRFGGIGMHFMTGLGNMSAAGGHRPGHRRACSRRSAAASPSPSRRYRPRAGHVAAARHQRAR